MRKLVIYSWILLMLFPILAHAKEKVYDRVLQQLDDMIEHKETYRAERERNISHLKQLLAIEQDERKRFQLCEDLFYLYLHYQADSALLYVNRAPLLDDPGTDVMLTIHRADAMGVMGAYNEALNEMEKINRRSITPELLLSYYYAMRTYYGWMADYTIIPEERQKYIDQIVCYRDSVLSLVEPSPGRSIALAEKYIADSKPEDAIPLLNKTLSEPMSMQEKAYVNYTLSTVYEAQNDVDMQIYYLAQTAIVDLTMSVREYASLQKLAWVLYQEGQVTRAYEYLSCSMEDAVACNARLRFLEVTEFYPIIDQAYSEQEARERKLSRVFFISLSIVTLLLIVLALYLYYGMKKLSVMRVDLSEANEELKSVNGKLEQTGRIKEVYIARYLDRCVSYLDKLEQYRRSLEKLAMASRIDDLFKAIRSEEFLREERKNFYMDFDKSFLELFPSFIEDFNALLEDDGKIYPKKGELLNTELRIFALIRLGVTDTSRIAHFLGYSLATVYNYRSRIRNKVKGDKETFELEVMKL